MDLNLLTQCPVKVFDLLNNHGNDWNFQLNIWGACVLIFLNLLQINMILGFRFTIVKVSLILNLLIGKLLLLDFQQCFHPFGGSFGNKKFMRLKVFLLETFF